MSTRTSRRASRTTSAARPRFTHRMAVLVLVLAVLVVSYASSMRAFVDQRSHLAELRAQIATSEGEIEDLRREQERWRDDAFIEAQARERFGWVMPGETSYQVIGRDGEPLAGADELPDAGSAPQEVPDPWWSKVRGSLEAADHPEDVEVPATDIDAPPRQPEE